MFIFRLFYFLVVGDFVYITINIYNFQQLSEAELKAKEAELKKLGEILELIDSIVL